MSARSMWWAFENRNITIWWILKLKLHDNWMEEEFSLFFKGKRMEWDRCNSCKSNGRKIWSLCVNSVLILKLRAKTEWFKQSVHKAKTAWRMRHKARDTRHDQWMYTENVIQTIFGSVWIQSMHVQITAQYSKVVKELWWYWWLRV